MAAVSSVSVAFHAESVHIHPFAVGGSAGIAGGNGAGSAFRA